MINLIDIVVLAFILIMAFVGYKRGLVKTAAGIVSFFLAIAISVIFYRPLAVILTEQTSIDDWIIENIEHRKEDETEDTKAELTEAEQEEISMENVFEKLPNAIIEKIDFEEAKATATHEIAIKVSEHVMNLLSLILIYVVVKVTLFIAEILLNGVMKLPVLKQVNEILGMCLGALMGFLEIYIAFAIITLISSITDITFVVSSIKASLFASFMFENNLIMKFLF